MSSQAADDRSARPHPDPPARAADPAGPVAVLGLGQIGGSLARCLAGTGMPVIGYDADPATVSAARAAGLPATDSVRDLDGCAVAVLAVPLPAVGALLGELAGWRAQPVLTDVASVKGDVLRLAAERAPNLSFVGGHPMAGTERWGFAAADPSLFRGAPWVLCLERDTDLRAWLTVAAVAVATGAHVVPATAARHDVAVAAVSHLPHLVAAAITAGAADNPLALALAAGSFRDGTRVIASRPELVAGMCEGNSAAVRESLADVVRHLEAFADALAAGAPLAPMLEAPHRTRVAWALPDTFETGELETGPLDAIHPGLRAALLDLGRRGGRMTALEGGRLIVGYPV